MTRVNVAEAKARLSDLIERVLRGEDVMISRRNRPLVRMVPVRAPSTHRRLGWARDLVTLADDFEDTPEDFEDYVLPARRMTRKS